MLRRHRATLSGCVNATLTSLGPQLADERFPLIACDGIVDNALVGAADRSTIPLTASTQISQAQSTHYRSRSGVDRHRFGEDSCQPHIGEAVSEKGGGTFRSQSLAPEIWQESIPQLCLSSLILVGRCEEPPADEDFAKKTCPEAETVSSRADAFLMVSFNFRTLSRFASTEVTHNAGIGVQSDLVFEVLVSQRNESQPAGLKGALNHVLMIAAIHVHGQSKLPAGGQLNAPAVATKTAHAWSTGNVPPAPLQPQSDRPPGSAAP